MKWQDWFIFLGGGARTVRRRYTSGPASQSWTKRLKRIMQNHFQSTSQRSRAPRSVLAVSLSTSSTTRKPPSSNPSSLAYKHVISHLPVVLVIIATNMTRTTHSQPPCLNVYGSCKIPVPAIVHKMLQTERQSTRLQQALRSRLFLRPPPRSKSSSSPPRIFAFE